MSSMYPTAVCLEQLTLVNGGISYNPTSFPRLEGAMATHSCNEGYTGGGTIGPACSTECGVDHPSLVHVCTQTDNFMSN